jgi:hypothetical protein
MQMTGATDQGTDKAAVLQRALRGMFRKLESRPAPDHILAVVDQLEAAQKPAKKVETA